jgi:mannose-6-phosphate isomerase
MYRLTGKVQHYVWGGRDYLPWLLGKGNAHHQPYAEYWMGVHSGGHTRVWLNDHAHTGLPDLIRSEPRRYLGSEVLQKFGDLPFLLKVLDVKSMLSIQVHPAKEAAKLGFDAENTAGVPLDSLHRNFKDANHKPEIMVALGDFWLLHGFLPEDELLNRLESTPELEFLIPIFKSGGYHGLYRQVMELSEEEVDKIIAPLARRVYPGYQAGNWSKSQPEFWVGRILEVTAPVFRGMDRGIFSIYFFNIVSLKEGQAIFQGPGLPHAYLEGQNIELMSNSDNVLRGGLTPKHIDVPELMKHIRFEATHPKVLDGIQEGAALKYICPIPDFTIRRVSLRKGEEYSWSDPGPQISIQVSGDLTWNDEMKCLKGSSVWVNPNEKCVIKALEDSILFLASVP